MTSTVDDHATLRSFYETYGWRRGPSGRFRDTEAFVDLRPVMARYHRRLERRLARLLGDRGRLLDVGCGGAPLPVATGRVRVNVDLARAALDSSRQVLGDDARYVQADVCRLPFPTGTFDRLLCAHVLYHLPPRRQRLALTEIHRVLAPGGVAIVVYSQPSAPLHRLARRLRSDTGPPVDMPPLPYHPVDYRLLQRDLRDRMTIEARTWGVLESQVTRALVPGNLVGSLMVAGVSAVEALLPRFSLRFARYPMLVVRKRDAGPPHEPR
jgi:SAM-dependent methyltransferase